MKSTKINVKIGGIYYMACGDKYHRPHFKVVQVRNIKPMSRQQYTTHVEYSVQTSSDLTGQLRKGISWRHWLDSYQINSMFIEVRLENETSGRTDNS